MPVCQKKTGKGKKEIENLIKSENSLGVVMGTSREISADKVVFYLNFKVLQKKRFEITGRDKTKNARHSLWDESVGSQEF